MLYCRYMVADKIFPWLIAVAVVAISVGYFVQAEPEESQIVSADTLVTVTGLARQTQPLVLETSAAVQAPLLGQAYSVKPDGITLDEPAVLSFRVPTEDRDRAPGLAVYRHQERLGMWEQVTPVVSHTDEMLAIETKQLGEFALGYVPSFTPPVFASVYDELRVMAPANAVGYEIAVGFYLAEQVPIRLLSVGEAGGCGGTVRVGDSEQISELTRVANVNLDNQDQAVSFVFVTRWFTASTGGCSSTEPLQPLSEYVILEASETH